MTTSSTEFILHIFDKFIKNAQILMPLILRSYSNKYFKVSLYFSSSQYVSDHKLFSLLQNLTTCKFNYLKI